MPKIVPQLMAVRYMTAKDVLVFDISQKVWAISEGQTGQFYAFKKIETARKTIKETIASDPIEFIELYYQIDRRKKSDE